jgi:LysM repeat protein
MEFRPPMQSSPVPCRVAAASLLTLILTAVPVTYAQSLLGSRSSLLRQNEAARRHDFTYLRTSSDVHEFAERGLLVRLSGNSDYRLASGYVSFPYARPEVKLFIERLGDQYRDACGERLIVTSLTRPITRQPANASHLSVHPTGMAVDLRRSSRSSCRRWLESTLLLLEGRGVLEATREKRPPHYHVTLFPDPYMRYLGNDRSDIQIAKSTSSSSSKSKTTVASSKKYRVGRGDTLWRISQRHGVSVSRLKQANGLRSSRLRAGQTLSIPTR